MSYRNDQRRRTRTINTIRRPDLRERTRKADLHVEDFVVWGYVICVIAIFLIAGVLLSH